MNVLKPIKIVPGTTLVSTTATESAAEWVSGATYNAADLCKRDALHAVYKRISGGAGTTPPEDDTDNWAYFRPTNDWAAFDDWNSTASTGDKSLTVVLSPGLVNALYLGGLDATGLAVTVKDAPDGAVIASYESELEGRIVSDWYEYLFEPFRPKTDWLVENMPLSPTAEITITLTSDATVNVGIVCIGGMYALGRTRHGSKAKIKSYTRVKEDDFGNTTITRRNRAKTMTVTSLVDAGDAAVVQAHLDDLDGVPALYIAGRGDDQEPLRIYGLGEFELLYESNAHRILSGTVKGFI